MLPERPYDNIAKQAYCGGSNKPTVKSVVRKLSGGSQSTLVVGSDGFHYILKTNANVQGPNLLANEWLGGYLACALGINVPPVRVLVLERQVIDTFAILRAERSGAPPIAPAPGLHFGSRMVGSLESLACPPRLPSRTERASVTNAADFLKMSLLDIWANNQDKREVLFAQESPTEAVQAVFIDNGHMFGGPDGSTRASVTPHVFRLRDEPEDGWPEHMIEEAVVRMEKVIPVAMRECLSTLPSTWYKGNIDSFQSKYMRRLENVRGLLSKHDLSSSRLWSHNDRFRICRIPGPRAAGPSAVLGG